MGSTGAGRRGRRCGAGRSRCGGGTDGAGAALEPEAPLDRTLVRDEIRARDSEVRNSFSKDLQVSRSTPLASTSATD